MFSSYSSNNRSTPAISSLIQSLPPNTYRDPTRTSTDASSLLSHPIGRNLRPLPLPLTLNDGTSHSRLLALQGTIAMTYRNNSYNIPIEIFLPPPYPLRPPFIFVRPVANMVIKDNHRHVGSDGMVYMPYLHRWKPATCNLTETCTVLSSLFGSDPPVYSRRTTTTITETPTATPVRVAAVTATSSTTTAEDYDANERRRLQVEAERRKEQEMLEAALAESRAEERRRVEERRRLDEEERLRLEEVRRLAEAEARREAEERRAREEKERDEMILMQTMRDDLTATLRRELTAFNDEAKRTITEDLHDQSRLDGGEKAIEAQWEELRRRKESLERHVAEVEEKRTILAGRLSSIEEKRLEPANDDGETTTSDIDALAIPCDVYSRQMLSLSAKNAAITDCLYFMDKALARGTIPLDVHLKKVRQLARKQFLVRAHLIKVGEVAKLNSIGRQSVC